MQLSGFTLHGGQRNPYCADVIPHCHRSSLRSFCNRNATNNVLDPRIQHNCINAWLQWISDIIPSSCCSITIKHIGDKHIHTHICDRDQKLMHECILEIKYFSVNSFCRKIMSAWKYSLSRTTISASAVLEIKHFCLNSYFKSSISAWIHSGIKHFFMIIPESKHLFMIHWGEQEVLHIFILQSRYFCKSLHWINHLCINS